MIPEVTILEADRRWRLPDLGEMWRARYVLLNFVNRSFRITYRQTIGGPIYAIYTPFMTMLGYTLLLGGLFGARDDTPVPYPLFSFSALIVWTLFTGTVQGVSMSLQKNSQLVQKIYIPRLTFPLIETSMELINFAIAFVILIIMMLLYGYLPTLRFLLLPVYTLLAVGIGLGLGLMFAGTQARIRDSNYVVQLITRGMFFLTPVVYASSRLPAPFDQLYHYNPMAVVVEGFRWALLDLGEAPTLTYTVFAFVVMVLTLLVGGLLFKRAEANIADVV